MSEGTGSPPESIRENWEAQKTDDEKLRAMFVHHVEMYRLPGDPPLTQNDIERYVESADALIASVDVERGLFDHDLAVQLRWAWRIDQAPEADQPRLRAHVTEIIEHGFEKENGFWTGLAAVNLIDQAPEADQPRLRAHVTEFVERSLENPGFLVRLAAADLIDQAPEADQPRLRAHVTKLVKQGFAERDPGVRSAFAELIGHAPEADRTRLIELGFSDEIDVVHSTVAQHIGEAPEADRTELIKRGLRDSYFFSRGVAAEAIGRAPEADRTELIELGLKNENYFARFTAAKAIGRAPEADRTRLIEESFKKDDFDVRYEAAQAIGHAPEADQPRLQRRILELIARGFEDKTLSGRLFAAKLISLAPEADRTRLIQEGFGVRDDDVRREAAKCIGHAPEADRARLVERGLSDSSAPVRRDAARFFNDVPEADRARLIALHPQGIDALQTLASTTPLYEHAPKKFFRALFKKTGSDTTLLDTVPGDPENTLRERLIIRHLTLDSVLSWKSAYEAAEFWKAKGFDYVPIEPIVKVTKKKEATAVNAFTRVLRGPSVMTWEATVNLYGAEIDAQVEKLRQALVELGVTHGHLHDGNFIVLFDRDEKGEAILTRPPRVYVIDFDQATS